MAIILFEFPCFIIPLLPQPTIGLPDIARILGGAIFAVGMAIAITAFLQMKAKRGIVRHPMYSGDVLWALG